MKPVIFGCSGLSLTEEERSFFKEASPFGFILFKRNCDTPEQVRGLVESMREVLGRFDASVFIDQEGGRVARLRPPHWPALPPLRAIGALYERDPVAGEEAAVLHTQLAACCLKPMGIDGNFAPVLDLLIEGASSAIGDRALSRNTNTITKLGGIILKTYLACGILPVIKHMPGHGRVKVDPHLELPFVDEALEILEQEDFVPFKNLCHAPAGMTCHVVFQAIDPSAPVSLSPLVHQKIIREALGFDGLLISDDLDMKALNHPIEASALKALWAGTDIALHCPGTLDAMRRIASSLPDITPKALERWEKARAQRSTAPFALDEKKVAERLAALLEKGDFGLEKPAIRNA